MNVDSQPLFEIRQASKVYRTGTKQEVRALDDVSFEIAAGEFVALMGPSGSGKTTLLSMLGALDRPTRGQILFAGDDLGKCSDVALARVRQRFGFVFQNYSLLPRLAAWENITASLVPRGVRSAERFQRARKLLDKCGIPDKINAWPEELSGGEQQRVALARALVSEPEVLLADEPTSNLDVDSAGGLIAILSDLHTAGTTVLVSTHDQQILALATTLIELRSGRIGAATPLEEST